MIGLSTTHRYYMYRHPTDMRKSFAGLAGLVINEMGVDPLQGDAYLFVNKRRTLIKVLIWDRTGFVIYYKKLSSGTFELPSWKEKGIVERNRNSDVNDDAGRGTHKKCKTTQTV